MAEQESLDAILKELTDKTRKQEAEQEAYQASRPTKSEAPAAADDPLLSHTQEERREKVSGFRLTVDLNEDFGQPIPDIAATSAVPSAEPSDDGEAEELQPLTDSKDDDAVLQAHKKKKKKKRTAFGCLRSLIYLLLVLAFSGTLAYFIIVGGIDMMGINQSTQSKDVEIAQGATTQEVADTLAESGIIRQPLVFRVYSRLTGADGTYQPGTFTLSPNMGYDEIIENLQVAAERESVSITFPEGITIKQVAELLEENGVCTTAEFFQSVLYDDFSDYSFLASIPDNENRIYRLEGYLFPDTYDFFVDSSANAAIRRMLNNFQTKVCENTTLMAAMKTQGMTVSDMVIMASILQREADNSVDMAKVSRVLWNRLNSDEFPRLQLDSTQLYVDNFYTGLDESSPIVQAYDTYLCEGLPVGAINSPGLDALEAAAKPSDDESVVNCYYFATDNSVSPSKTYYSETYDQHVAVCRRYGLGIYG